MAQSPITMFGAYVSNLSISLGWGGQGGSMQLTLVEDEDNGITIPRSGGQVFNGGSVERDGVTIVAPPTGTACYFKYGEFYFGGIFQRWTYKEDATQGRTYDVIIDSPSKLMDGVQCIIENYNGTTDRFANQYNQYQISTNLGTDAVRDFHSFYGTNSVAGLGAGSLFNVYNLFAFYENPEFGNFVTDYTNFGSSKFNSGGTPIFQLLYALDALAKIDSPNVWGGPMKFGDESAGEYGVTEYGLDMTAVDAIYEEIGVNITDLENIRIQGPVKSINALISEIAEYHQWDYFYSIEPVGGAVGLADGGGLILNDDKPQANIVIKTVSKGAPPVPDQIQQFITAEVPKGTVMSYSIGKEWADVTTQKILWGGRRSRYIQINGRTDYGGGGSRQNPSVDSQLAVWGRSSTITPELSYYTVGLAGAVYGTPLNRIPIPTEAGPHACSPFELRMALAGKESWTMFKTMESIANGDNLLDVPWTASIEPTKNILNLLAAGTGNAFDVMQTSLARSINQWEENKKATCDKIFSAVNDIATQSYKQEYFCFLPNEVNSTKYNIYFPEEESEDLRSWRVSSSAFIKFGGFAPSGDVAFFDQSGKMKPCVGYPFVGRSGGTADLSPLGGDYALGQNGASGLVVSLKGSPGGDDRWYLTSFPDTASGVWGVLFKTGVQPREFDASTTPDFGLTVIASILGFGNIPPAAYIGSGKTSLQFAVPPDALDPLYFGIPQESERFNYGPWVTVNQSKGGTYSPTGKAEAEENTQMTPETYGDYGILNAVGALMTTTSNAVIHQSETGYIQMVGAPLANLGQRFASLGPYVTSMDISVDATGGVTTSYKFDTWTPQFGKLAKYNVDRIAKINKNNWARAQKLRSKIEKPPFPKIRFEKTNFEQQKDKSKFAHFDPGGIQQFFRQVPQVNQEDINRA